MSDIKQFSRELLEGRSIDTAVRGTITHALRITLYDPSFPPTWLLQHETNGSLYSDVFITRDEALKEIREGDELVFHRIAPEKEGHPFFLYASALPVEPPQPAPENLPKITKVDAENPIASNYDFDAQDPPKKFDETANGTV